MVLESLEERWGQPWVNASKSQESETRYLIKTLRHYIYVSPLLYIEHFTHLYATYNLTAHNRTQQLLLVVEIKHIENVPHCLEWEILVMSTNSNSLYAFWLQNCLIFHIKYKKWFESVE